MQGLGEGRVVKCLYMFGECNSRRKMYHLSKVEVQHCRTTLMTKWLTVNLRNVVLDTQGLRNEENFEVAEGSEEILGFKRISFSGSRIQGFLSIHATYTSM